MPSKTHADLICPLCAHAFTVACISAGMTTRTCPACGKDSRYFNVNLPEVCGDGEELCIDCGKRIATDGKRCVGCADNKTAYDREREYEAREKERSEKEVEDE